MSDLLPPPAATAERLRLAVELDEAHRPEDWSPTLDWIGYADELEHVASEALGHCQRLEAQLDRLARAGEELAAKAERLVGNLAAEDIDASTLADLDRRDADPLQAAFRAQAAFRGAQG